MIFPTAPLTLQQEVITWHKEDQTPLELKVHEPNGSQAASTQAIEVKSIQPTLRVGFIRKVYLFDKIGLALSSLAAILTLTTGNTFAFMWTLPFVLGFGNMYLTVRRDIKKLL